MFSRATEPRSITPPSAKELDAVIKRVTGRWKADVTVSLVEGFADLPANIQKSARDQGSNGSDIRGVFHQGTIYVVRDNIASIKEVARMGSMVRSPNCAHSWID